MKNKVYAIVAIALAIFATGCAKTHNKYDKYLTDGSWTLSSMNKSSDDESTDVSGGTRHYERNYNTESFSSGEYTATDRYEEEETGVPNYFEEYSYTGDKTCSITFNEDGTYTMETSVNPTSYSYEETGTPLSTTSLSGYETSSVTTGNWNWGDNKDTKTEIILENMGSYTVTVEKDKLVWERSSSDRQEESYAGDTYTSETTEMENWTWSK